MSKSVKSLFFQDQYHKSSSLCGFNQFYMICDCCSLKEYYEIVNEACPLSGFFPIYADFVTENTFLIMKLSKLQSFRAIRPRSNCFTIDVRRRKKSYFLIVICISYYTSCGRCFDMRHFGNRFVIAWL